MFLSLKYRGMYVQYITVYDMFGQSPQIGLFLSSVMFAIDNLVLVRKKNIIDILSVVVIVVALE